MIGTNLSLNADYVPHGRIDVPVDTTLYFSQPEGKVANVMIQNGDPGNGNN